MRRSPLLIATTTTAILLIGAVFGFFYAWVCSTMWGLDDADPRVAIAAMQAMNDSVRNAVFFPAFFLTPVALLLAAGLARRERHRTSAVLLASAAGVYTFGGLLLTMTVNVPMNEALAEVSVPEARDAAAAIWADYSRRWQIFNVVRTIASGISLALATLAVFALRSPATGQDEAETVAATTNAAPSCATRIA